MKEKNISNIPKKNLPNIPKKFDREMQELREEIQIISS